jgi:hypothetical protein
MGEKLTYWQRTFDTVHIAAGQPVEARFFETHPYLDGSTRVTEFHEKQIVRWLMLCRDSRDLILEALRLPAAAFYCPEVVSPFYEPGKGDIDLILCPPLLPSEALVLECKCIKVESVNADQDKMNKLQRVGGGVCQAKRLYDLHAFFETYLAIITLVDASSQDQDVSNILFRGVRSDTTPQDGDTKTTTFKQIVEFPGRSELYSGHYDHIGIIHIEVVQPSRLSIDKQATVAVCVFRRAKPREQHNNVTHHIREIMHSDAQWRNA